MALTYSTMVPLNSRAADFSLPGTDGRTYTLDSFNDARVLVLIFMCNHCPYVKAVLPRLIDLQNQFRDRGVRLAGINCNDADRYPDDSFESMQTLAREKNLPFPYLFDASQNVARTYDAVCTPDIYVYGGERTLVYRGRIDDDWERPDRAARHDLQDAVESILAGRPVNPEQIPSMGCSIKWKA
ncbi:MAG: thioredoxin family protein [Nitrospinae bacterium CG11_big_fil_rev_8_21_14_0_20_56_8]|nr:MAG: thioredoxin family protein [Nitrospinae bacterium CG11_big_fil_rev_8_21_14_0_20_56_8]